MKLVFASFFFVGLLAAVRVMLYGVERHRIVGDDTPRSFSRSPAVIASFAAVTGMVGYILVKFDLGPAIIWIAALTAGLLAAAVTARAIVRWWSVVPDHDVDDERYVLQGSLAQVVTDIGERGVGEVTLKADASQRPMPARTIDDQAVAAGTEVVIERIEDGVAFVEEWAQVEKRL